MPTLLDQLQAQSAHPVAAGRTETPSGELRWGVDGIWLDGLRLERVAAQLSQGGEASSRGGWRARWGRQRRPQLLIELRTAGHRLRLAARVDAALLDGLPELAMSDATALSERDALALLHAVHAHDGRFVVAPPEAGRVDLPVPDAVAEPSPAPPGPTPPRRLQAALRARALWLAGLPVVLLPLFGSAVSDYTGLASSTLFALAMSTYALVPWLVGGIYAAVCARRGGLEQAQAGAAAGFGIGVMAAGWMLLGLACNWWLDPADTVSFVLLAAGFLATLGLLHLLDLHEVPRRLWEPKDPDDHDRPDMGVGFLWLFVAFPSPLWIGLALYGVWAFTRVGARLADPVAFERDHARRLAERDR